MKKDLTEVIWNGTLVGHIENLKIDNFFVYGRWIPETSPAHDAFKAAIQGATDDVSVQIGHGDPPWIGTIEEVPQNEIEIHLRPGGDRV